MGPAAGLRLHRLILENTKASCDQEHLKVIHMSLSDMIADRTESLQIARPDVPAEGMAAVISAAARICQSMGLGAVAGVPCNTFHADPIWSVFSRRLDSLRQRPQLINMIDETVESIRNNCAAGCGIGILSTTGTRIERLYSAPLEASGFNVIEPEDQDAVHSMIYDPLWGIKASIEVSRRAASAVRAQIDFLERRGAELVILGCTELPLALEHGIFPAVKLLDPMTILARALVKAAEPDKLKEI